MSVDSGDAPLEAWEIASEHFEALGGPAYRRPRGIAPCEFGAGSFAFDRPLTSLSGGEKTRASLAALVATDPDLLLLDEPSNHLDRDGIAWLESFLRRRAGATLIVSHDRALLDAVADKLLAIDEDNGTLREFKSGYSEFRRSPRTRSRQVAGCVPAPTGGSSPGSRVTSGGSQEKRPVTKRCQ
ncbi:MAG: ATP-binding cassette domain-containing protein [Thermomicrobiales bacterium]